MSANKSNFDSETSLNSNTTKNKNIADHEESDLVSSLKENRFINKILQTPTQPSTHLYFLDDFSLPSTEAEGKLRHWEERLRKLADRESREFRPAFTEYRMPDGLNDALKSPLPVTDKTNILLPLASHVINPPRRRDGLKEAMREICSDASLSSSDSFTALIDQNDLRCLKVKKSCRKRAWIYFSWLLGKKKTISKY